MGPWVWLANAGAEMDRWEAELQSNTFRGAEVAFSLKNQHPHQLLCFHCPR